MTTAELAKSWLHEQGYKCNLDEDGDAIFKYEGANMLVTVDKDDPLFFKIMMPSIYEVENNRDRVLETINIINTKIKVVKAILIGNNVHLFIEMFVDTTPEIDDFFERCCDILIASRRIFIEELRG